MTVKLETSPCLSTLEAPRPCRQSLIPIAFGNTLSRLTSHQRIPAVVQPALALTAAFNKARARTLSEKLVQAGVALAAGYGAEP